MKIILLIFTTILLVNISSAQKKQRGTDGSNTVKYTLISDSEDFNFLGGGLGLNFTGSGYNTSFGFDAGLSAHFGKLDLSFWYYNKMSGLTADNNTSSSDAFSMYETTSSNNFDIRAAFAVKSETENADINVIVKTTGNSKVSISYYLKVPAREKTMYMAELGYNKGITFYKVDANNFKAVKVGESTIETLEGRVSTMMQYSILNFGVSRVKCARVQINTNDYGKKESIYYKKIYGRLSLLMSHELDDVLVPGPYLQSNEYMYYQYDINTKTEVSKIGMNIGISNATPNKTRSYWYAEAGIMPGPKAGIGANGYLGFGFGLYISKLFN